VHRKRHGALTPTPRQQSASAEARPTSPRWSGVRRLKILPDLQLAADPPPLAPARWEPMHFAWVSASSARSERGFGDARKWASNFLSVLHML
jgi:hypothetical protein